MDWPIIADFSNPDHYNEKYIPLFHSKKRYNFLMGGWGSGKSVAVAENEIIKTYTPDNGLLGVRKVKDTIKDSMYAEMVWVIERWWLQAHFEIKVSPLYIRNKLTGTDAIFRGMDDPEKVKSVHGRKRIWIEEASEFTKEDFNQLDLRLRGEWMLQITASWNPIDEDHFLLTDFWSKWTTEEQLCIHSTYLDNRFVWDEYRKVMERLKEQDYRMYEIYALGKPWRRVEWQVYENWEEIDSVPDEAKFVGRGLDFWFSNDPTGIIGVYEWNGGLILDEELYRTHMTNPDIVAFLKSIWANTSDDIIADSSEPKSIEEISRAWFNIYPVAKWPDSVRFGIWVVKTMKIYFTKRSSNLRKEYMNYVWKKDRNGKVLNDPIDLWNHLMDALRYFIMTKYGMPDDEPQVYFL